MHVYTNDTLMRQHVFREYMMSRDIYPLYLRLAWKRRVYSKTCKGNQTIGWHIFFYSSLDTTQIGEWCVHWSKRTTDINLNNKLFSWCSWFLLCCGSQLYVGFISYIVSCLYVFSHHYNVITIHVLKTDNFRLPRSLKLNISRILQAV